MTDFQPPVVPIQIDCEGSNARAHPIAGSGGNGFTFGICAMCGKTVWCNEDGTAPSHQREDIIAMLNRGDFG